MTPAERRQLVWAPFRSIPPEHWLEAQVIRPTWAGTGCYHSRGYEKRADYFAAEEFPISAPRPRQVDRQARRFTSVQQEWDR